MNATSLGGRPPVGPVFQVRFPEGLLAQVDQAAAAEELSRAAWLRAAAQERLQISRAELSTFVHWLLDQMVEPSEIARVVEKPENYHDWLGCFRDGGDLSDLDHPQEADDSQVPTPPNSV